MGSTRKLIEQIAKKHFGVETIETRNSDSKDFYDVSIGAIEEALRTAYDAGKAAAAPKLQDRVRSRGEWYTAFPDSHAEGGFDFARRIPEEMKELLGERSLNSDERHMSRADVAKLVHAFGLTGEQLDLSALR